MKNSSWTGRAARDLEGAFGPHIRSSQCRVEPMPEQRSAFDRALPYVYAACAVGAVAALVLNNFH
ncbi:hypothetical protein ACEN9J_02850 [Variovorax sp. Varisp41]|uniref:hypothetical protein n=1 Tax=Variovorax sp. Varisp41 TaxID=3243033 RepID=UPI0039B5698D